MGQDPSADTPDPVADFYGERFLTGCTQRTQQFPPVRFHSASELTDLLLGCYEQLSNVPEILDALIQAAQALDHPILTSLDRDLLDFYNFANLRQISMNSVSAKFNSTLCLHRINQPRKPLVSFAAILEAFEFGASEKLNSRQTSTISSLKASIEHLNPESALSPPSAQFHLDYLGQRELIAGRSV
jgi:hypothetical protein